MPLLFYWPLIVWMGMVEVAQSDIRRRVVTPARVRSLQS